MKTLPGYRRLLRIDFILSRCFLFGVFLPLKVLLPRRPLKRFFWLGSLKQAYLDMTVVSERREGIRGAVEVKVTYYSITGRSIQKTGRVYQLFADPIGQATSQRLWFTRPLKAAFAVIAISRAKNGLAIGMHSKVSLKRGSYDQIEVALGEILRCRDEQLLESAYAKAEEDCESEHARRILGRMIFIWQKPEAFRALAYLEDARKLAARGFKLTPSLPCPNVGDNTIIYDHLFSKGSGVGATLTKLLAYESRLLQTRMFEEQARVVHIPPGADAFMRLVVAVESGANVKWEAGTDTFDVPAWITLSEAQEYIKSYGA